MSEKSPLFVSALELIAHATELYAQKKTKNYKFIILHLANAVELILKDYVIDLGMSIYKNKEDKTIGLWECIQKLEQKDVILPELPVIQLLIDDRNNIQHRFGYPSDVAIFYYIEQVILFFERFLKDCYSIQIYEVLKAHISEEDLKLIGLSENEKDIVDIVDKLSNISLRAAILEIYAYIEHTILEDIVPTENLLLHAPSSMIWRNSSFKALIKDLQTKKYLSGDISYKLEKLRKARNTIAHNQDGALSQDEALEALSIGKEFVTGIQNAKKAGYIFYPSIDDRPL